jgi:acetylornithine/succinyldiaminopimelate/putrescine aminotransferase
LTLQAFAGIVTVSVGHCHPEVVAAINRQNGLLQHTTTIYLNNEIAEYAKELADKMPGNLKVLVNCTKPIMIAAQMWHCSNGLEADIVAAAHGLAL